MSDEKFSVIADEQVGQLYAYRINNSAVVLGTRRSSTFGASIGIGSVAQGKYKCIAENENANRELDITVSLLSKSLYYIGCEFHSILHVLIHYDEPFLFRSNC